MARTDRPYSQHRPVSRNPYADARAREAYRAQIAARQRKQRNRRIVGGVAASVLLLVLVGVGLSLFQMQDADPEQTPSSPFAALVANDDAPNASSVIMTLGGDAETYVIVGEEYLEAGCHAYLPEEGNLSDVRIEGSVNTRVPGDYTVTYTASPASGGRATAQRTVHVVEDFERFDGEARTLPVLMYHYVYAEDDAPAELDGNYILDTKLAAQLQYLVDQDYYYPSYQEIRAFAQGKHTLPARSVVITFDDAEQGFLKYGTPLLEQYRVPGTSFMICSDPTTEDKIRDYSNPYVSWQSHSYGLHQAGSSIGRGGIIHALTVDEIVDDLKQAQAMLGSTEAFAYPFGDNNEQAWAALEKADVLCGFTIENRRIVPGDQPEALPRVRISGEYSQESFEYLVTPNGGEQ